MRSGTHAAASPNNDGKYFPSVDDDNKGARSNSPLGGDQKEAFYIMNMTIYIYERCCQKKKKKNMKRKMLLKSVAISDGSMNGNGKK